MTRYLVLCTGVLCAGVLAGCTELQGPASAPDVSSADPTGDSGLTNAAQATELRPQARPEDLSTVASANGAQSASAPPKAPPPPPKARTVEEFDTTTAADRAEAAAAPAAPAERKLGETVASLGDPTKPGFWLETPLVSAPTTGRVVFPGSGKSSQVDLIPIDGPATAGSRISLAAMRLIEAPLTDLPTIEVYAGG